MTVKTVFISDEVDMKKFVSENFEKNCEFHIIFIRIESDGRLLSLLNMLPDSIRKSSLEIFLYECSKDIGELFSSRYNLPGLIAYSVSTGSKCLDHYLDVTELKVYREYLSVK